VSKTLGLIAGDGQFPIEVAAGARAQGYRVVALAIRGSASRDLARHVDAFYWVSVARIGQMVRRLRRESARNAVVAGKVHHTNMFDPRRIVHYWPDCRFLRMWYRRLHGDRRADSILCAFADELAQDGIHMDSSIEHAPHLTVPPGCLTRRRPSARERADIVLGWTLAKAMGGLDVGQAVVVKEGAVLAVEAAEGTDECIRRGAHLGRGDVVVVKVAKPNQDLRFDLPTIGPETIAVMIEAGARVLAIEAEKTLVLQREALIRAADDAKRTVIALSADEMASPS
jgi:DUF1009 family protein